MIETEAQEGRTGREAQDWRGKVGKKISRSEKKSHKEHDGVLRGN